MKSWKTRLGLVLAMLAMVLAVSVPAMADHEGDFEEFLDEEEFVVEVELEDCDIVDEDGDGVDDEEIFDGFDNDGDISIDEDVELLCEVESDAFGDFSYLTDFDEFDDEDVEEFCEDLDGDYSCDDDDNDDDDDDDDDDDE